jgi:hypothetical protein
MFHCHNRLRPLSLVAWLHWSAGVLVLVLELVLVLVLRLVLVLVLELELVEGPKQR